MPQGARLRGRVLAVSCMAMLVAGAALVVWGGLRVGADHAEESRYEQLASDSLVGLGRPESDGSAAATGDGHAAEGDVRLESGRDWQGLRALNPDIAAWLSVQGTPIDYPVMVAAADKPEDYYLTHDAWGGETSVGCPFIGEGSSASGPHTLVYGHHVGTTSKQFTPVSRAFEQEVFDGLGACAWELPDGEGRVLEPLCALEVDAGFEAIQTYEFDGSQAFRSWLRGLCGQASARSAAWESRCATAEKAVTLVTCSSVVAGQSGRTLVVFCA